MGAEISAWNVVLEVRAADESGHVRCAYVLAANTKNSIVLSESHLLPALGIENLVVVESADALLVLQKTEGQSVKELVSWVETAQRKAVDFHREVHRPWGTYEWLVTGDRYPIKHIVVKPSRGLLLQFHDYRSEHMIVLRFTARIRRGDETVLLSENQCTCIPFGVKHRLENSGKIDLELVEVQSGAYLSEDDIVRFEDPYGKTK